MPKLKLAHEIILEQPAPAAKGNQFAPAADPLPGGFACFKKPLQNSLSDIISPEEKTELQELLLKRQSAVVDVNKFTHRYAEKQFKSQDASTTSKVENGSDVNALELNTLEAFVDRVKLAQKSSKDATKRYNSRINDRLKILHGKALKVLLETIAAVENSERKTAEMLGIQFTPSSTLLGLRQNFEQFKSMEFDFLLNYSERPPVLVELLGI